jgi:uncharacterized paraquat-inducible protein A
MPLREDDKADLGDSDWGNDDQVEMVDCPNCRRSVYEESERCPHCGHYITEEDPRTSYPLWVVITAVICLALALGWVLWG